MLVQFYLVYGVWFPIPKPNLERDSISLVVLFRSIAVVVMLESTVAKAIQRSKPIMLGSQHFAKGLNGGDLKIGELFPAGSSALRANETPL